MLRATVRSWGERQCGPAGLCLCWGQGWGPGVSWAHSLLASLKHKSGNEGTGGRGVAAAVRCLGHLGLSERGRMGGSGLVPSLVGWLVAGASSWQCIY